MRTEEAILDVVRLLADGQALCEALIAGDLPEGRFRARLIEGQAKVSGVDGVEVAAHAVVRFLGKPGTLPLRGYAQAVLALSAALDAALAVATA